MSESDQTAKTTTAPAREKVDELLDELEDMGWVTYNYKVDPDPFDPLCVDLKLEYQGGWGESDG